MSDIETLMKELTSVSLEKQRIIDRETEIKTQLFQVMQEQKVTKLETSRIVVNYIQSFVKKTIDSELLRKKYPDIADKCTKSTPVDDFLRVRVKT